LGGILFQGFKRMSSSKLLAKLIFDVDIYPYDDCTCPYWDLTTLMLRNILNRYIKNGQMVLEIGTGPFAILSTYIAKRKDIEIIATDINPFFIENAKKNTQKNNVTIRLLNSDLFSKVDGPFDVIFFNPPYVPSSWVLQNHKEMYTDSVFDLVWNGGRDGCDIIRRFLNEVAEITHRDSIVLLGVNSFFVDMVKMNKLIDAASLVSVSTVSSIGNPSKVYIIRTS
jgi:release factor glutamine methyltransferase